MVLSPTNIPRVFISNEYPPSPENNPFGLEDTLLAFQVGFGKNSVGASVNAEFTLLNPSKEIEEKLLGFLWATGQTQAAAQKKPTLFFQWGFPEQGLMSRIHGGTLVSVDYRFKEKGFVELTVTCAGSVQKSLTSPWLNSSDTNVVVKEALVAGPSWESPGDVLEKITGEVWGAMHAPGGKWYLGVKYPKEMKDALERKMETTYATERNGMEKAGGGGLGTSKMGDFTYDIFTTGGDEGYYGLLAQKKFYAAFGADVGGGIIDVPAEDPEDYEGTRFSSTVGGDRGTEEGESLQATSYDTFETGYAADESHYHLARLGMGSNGKTTVEYGQLGEYTEKPDHTHTILDNIVAPAYSPFHGHHSHRLKGKGVYTQKDKFKTPSPGFGNAYLKNIPSTWAEDHNGVVSPSEVISLSKERVGMNRIREIFENQVFEPTYVGLQTDNLQSRRYAGRYEYLSTGEVGQPGAREMRDWYRTKAGKWEWRKPTIGFARKFCKIKAIDEQGLYSDAGFIVPNPLFLETKNPAHDMPTFFRLTSKSAESVLKDLAKYEKAYRKSEKSISYEGVRGVQDNLFSRTDLGGYFGQETPSDSEGGFWYPGRGEGSSGSTSAEDPYVTYSTSKKLSFYLAAKGLIDKVNELCHDVDVNHKLGIYFVQASNLTSEELSKMQPLLPGGFGDSKNDEAMIICGASEFKSAVKGHPPNIKSYPQVNGEDNSYKLSYGGKDSIITSMSYESNIMAGFAKTSAAGSLMATAKATLQDIKSDKGVQAAILSVIDGETDPGWAEPKELESKIREAIKASHDRWADVWAEEAIQSLVDIVMDGANASTYFDETSVNPNQRNATNRKIKVGDNEQEVKAYMARAALNSVFDIDAETGESAAYETAMALTNVSNLAHKVTLELLGIPEISNQHAELLENAVDLHVPDLRDQSDGNHFLTGKYLLQGYAHRISPTDGYKTYLSLFRPAAGDQQEG